MAGPAQLRLGQGCLGRVAAGASGDRLLHADDAIFRLRMRLQPVGRAAAIGDLIDARKRVQEYGKI